MEVVEGQIRIVDHHCERVAIVIQQSHEVFQLFSAVLLVLQLCNLVSGDTRGLRDHKLAAAAAMLLQLPCDGDGVFVRRSLLGDLPRNLSGREGLAVGEADGLASEVLDRFGEARRLSPSWRGPVCW